MRILITGATGNVGANIAKHAAERGHEVHIITRKSSRMTGLKGIRVVQHAGDINEPESLIEAMRGCEAVFHVAALVTFWKSRAAEAHRVNVIGTQNVVDACRAAGVRVLVHTSTVSAVGYTDTPAIVMDENWAFNWPVTMVYHYTKYCAEKLALGANGPNLKVVAINPCLVFGERDSYLSAGRMLVQIKQGRGIAAIDGGTCVCDADDVARAHLDAVEKGRGGERYIAGSTNHPIREVMAMAAEEVGARPPLFAISGGLARGLAPVVRAFEGWASKEPLLTGDMLYDGGTWHYFNSAKARRELGAGATEPRVSIAKCHKWLRDNGMMPG